MKNIKGCAFDAFGTIFDVHSVVEKCDEVFPGRGQEISIIWRGKQLEYSWLMSLMGRYETFFSMTKRALIFALKSLGLDYTDELMESILAEYYTLKPFPEVPGALKDMQDHGKKLSILSNGDPAMLKTVVDNNDLQDVLGSISVDELKIFKPAQEVYELGPKYMGIPKEQILFVSSNSFDVIGAKVFGFKVAWINRAGNQLDELGEEPDVAIQDMQELADLLKG